jgi:hypothetical protein
VIVVEDDLLFAPDFLEYFEANAPLLDIDPTTFVLRLETRRCPLLPADISIRHRVT